MNSNKKYVKKLEEDIFKYSKTENGFFRRKRNIKNIDDFIKENYSYIYGVFSFENMNICEKNISLSFNTLNEMMKKEFKEFESVYSVHNEDCKMYFLIKYNKAKLNNNEYKFGDFYNLIEKYSQRYNIPNDTIINELSFIKI